MLGLVIPVALKQEFATVDALWHSNAETRRVDALLLSWVKYEKQLRRLFCFFLFQHPNINEGNIDDVITVLVNRGDLYPETFLVGIEALGVVQISDLLAPRYAEVWSEIKRIKRYRNKLMHGQISGQKIKSQQLERDVLWIVDWITCLATAAESAFGYDGLRRNTYRVAKSNSKIAVENYPFTTSAELKKWIEGLVMKKHMRRAAQ